MLKTVTAICLVLNLCACLSIGSGEIKSEVPETVDLNHWITVPKQNELIVIGVSGLQTRREAEIENARRDAAGKISMFYSVQAVVESMQITGGFLDHVANTSITVEFDQELERYIDRLTFDPERDLFIRDNAVFIRFTYPASFPGNISYHFGRNPNGSPRWTNSPPQEINGFKVGVGFSRRQARIRDTIMRSAESAVAALVSRVSSVVQAGETSTFVFGDTHVRHQSIGRLTHFTILEIWIDPDTESVWTLAVARNAD